jgi:hypothetical protein
MAISCSSRIDVPFVSAQEQRAKRAQKIKAG